MRPRGIAFVIVLVSVALVCPAAASSSAPVDLEKAARIKAAYLYHLAKLATWPAGTFTAPDDSLRICIVGDDPFDLVGLFSRTKLDLQAGRHPLCIERVGLEGETDLLGRLARFHLVFFTETARHLAWQVLRQGPPEGLLITAEIDGFCENGGMVGFEIGDGRVRIEVNRNALRRGDLRLSAEFMQHTTPVDPVPDRRD